MRRVYERQRYTPYDFMELVDYANANAYPTYISPTGAVKASEISTKEYVNNTFINLSYNIIRLNFL